MGPKQGYTTLSLSPFLLVVGEIGKEEEGEECANNGHISKIDWFFITLQFELAKLLYNIDSKHL